MESKTPDKQKEYERNTFIFLTVFLAPILSIFIVGGFGFLVWISQMIFGPPTA
ncbi:MAG: periplasmic nitrate reductase, NapE protein [Kangiellaceae bacterium]|nr:periplasmic nitrate reductase, NapE protein [Kangiellaceae bacterium]